MDLISSPFQLGSSHWTLFDGYQLELRNTNGDTASVSLMTAFRPLVRNILGGTAPMRQADPYSMVFDANTKALFVVDSGSDTLVRIDTLSGRAATLVRFQPDVRAGVAIDSVPTAVCQTEDGFLISFLPATPSQLGRLPYGGGNQRTADGRPSAL